MDYEGRNMKKNDIFICGYYGMKNSGDDALLLAAAWGARQYFETKTMAINSPIPIRLNGLGKQPPVLLARQKFIGQNRLLQYLASVKSNHIVFGGGSVFHSSRDINIFRHMMMLAGAGPHRAIGVSLGPFKNLRAEIACKKFLNECDFIGVRDQQSVDIAQAIAPNASVALTFDLAPLLLEIPYQGGFVEPLPRRGIGVALCPNERLFGNAEAESKRIKALAKSLNTTCQQTGEPLYLIDFNGHDEFGDSPVHDELRALISNKIPVFRITYDSNPLRLLNRLRGLKAMVAMRLHASVFAFLANTPVISLNYHSKCTGWCEQVGMKKSYQIDADFIDSDYLEECLIKGLNDGFINTTLKPEQALNFSKNNFLSQAGTLGEALC